MGQSTMGQPPATLDTGPGDSRRKWVEQWNAETLEVANVTGDNGQSVLQCGGRDEHVGLGPDQPPPAQVAAQASRPGGDRRSDVKNRALLVEKCCDRFLDPGIGVRRQTARDLLDRDHADDDSRDPSGPAQHPRVGLAAHEFEEHVGVSEFHHATLPNGAVRSLRSGISKSRLSAAMTARTALVDYCAGTADSSLATGNPSVSAARRGWNR